ncbi:hypothetical protein D1872_183550 [compost metagenome]
MTDIRFNGPDRAIFLLVRILSKCSRQCLIFNRISQFGTCPMRFHQLDLLWMNMKSIVHILLQSLLRLLAWCSKSIRGAVLIDR